MGRKVLAAVLVGSLVLIGGQAAARAGHRSQQFLVVAEDGNPDAQVQANGVFDGLGVEAMGEERFDEAGNGRYTGEIETSFVFDEGTLLLTLEVRGLLEFDEETCSSTNSGKGRYTVTGGDGVFAGAEGRGSLTFDIASTAERNTQGDCPEDAPDVGVFSSKLTGTLQLEQALPA